MTGKRALLSGAHFMNGDVACAEGAIAAGCRFFAGYPITPATEIAEHLSQRMPEFGGIYVQMEDEIASMAAVIGASYSGLKAMTATSGPGFSLMQAKGGSHGDYGIIALSPSSVQEMFDLTVEAFNLAETYRVPTLLMGDEIVAHMWGKVG